MKDMTKKPFTTIYNETLKELTQNNRIEIRKLAKSILQKQTSYEDRTKKEYDLLLKIQNWINRSFFEFEVTIQEILELCVNEDKQSQITYQQFVKDAIRQSASEKAQLKAITEQGFDIRKLRASGKESLRFTLNNQSFTSVKIKGETSHSFDYLITHETHQEYCMGKVTFSQGGHQDTVKDEIIDFLKRANQYIQHNPNSNYKFTALIDGDSLLDKDIKIMKKYTNDRVRLMNCDNYKL